MLNRGSKRLPRRLGLSADSNLASIYMGKKFTPVPEQTALAHSLIILNSTHTYSDILVLGKLIDPAGRLNFNYLLKSQTPMKVF